MNPVIQTENSTDDSDVVRVLSRGLVLLKAFCPRNDALTNSELSGVTGLPRPTVSRITATLMRLGYLDYLPEKTQYRLGHAALGLGFGTLSTLDVRLRARERMQRFADEEDLLVVLSVRDGMAMVSQVVCRGRGALTVRLEVGSRVALPFSAMGRAWAAALEPAARAAVLEEITQHFPGHDFGPEMEEAARQISKSGFCMTISKLEPDLMGAATVVNLPRAQGPYLLGCAVPAFRYPRERCEAELGPKMMSLRRLLEEDVPAPLVMEPN
ncbi:MAG: helix-turn-helix domain-containing protein [Pseudomonadota bacterium]